MTDCVFCRIASGEINSDVVHSGEHVVAFRDINPQAPTHIQIIPRRHVAKIADFAAEQDASWLVEAVEVANALAASEAIGDGYRLIVNNGALAGQSVFHVHMHLVGGRAMRWPPG